ncbi:MAG: hypothetical protein WC284_18670 [Candidimonas sp.]
MYQPQIGDIVEWNVEPPLNGIVTNVHEDDDGDVMVDLDFVDHKPVGVSVDEVKLLSTSEQRFVAYEEKLLQRLREYPTAAISNEQLEMWEILVPTVRNDGTPIRTRFHRVWDAEVRKYTGGLTVMPVSKGQWVSPNGTLFVERMIPVRVACRPGDIEQIIQLTLRHYNDQEAVMATKISDHVVIRHRSS